MSGSVWIASYVLLWVAVIVLGLVCVALLRQVGVLHARVRPLGVHFSGEGPDVGTDAPDAADVDYGASALTVVAFTSEDCTICRTLIPGLRGLWKQYRDVTLRVVEHAPATTEVFEAFNVRSTPYFVGVDHEGVVRVRGVGNTLEQVEMLIEEGLRDPSEKGVSRGSSP